MPLPLALGRFNTRVTNRIIGPILVRFPWYGWLFHVGRRTGRRYRTPIMLFRRGDQAVIALTYGERTQWLKNVLVAGSCSFESPGDAPLQLASPEFVHDPSRRLVPWIIRIPLTVLRVSDFIALRVVDGSGAVGLAAAPARARPASTTAAGRPEMRSTARPASHLIPRAVEPLAR